MNLAPIVLFTYKRLDTLIQTVEALQTNYLAKESELIVFSDSAKGEKDFHAVAKVRTYLKTIAGFKSITIHEADKNKGLANSIISGVNQVLEEYDSVIVMEDDLVSCPNFLNFMNDSLQKMRNEKAVFSISGFSFNLCVRLENNYDTYFLNRGWSWGWATWKDRWNQVDWNVSDYKHFIKNNKEQKAFSQGGSDLNSMLKKQMNGDLDSWAIRWFYHQFKIKGLTLYPVHSLIDNKGFDERATHTTGSSRRYVPILDKGNKTEFCFPNEIEVTKSYQLKFQQKMGVLSRIRSKIETILGI